MHSPSVPIPSAVSMGSTGLPTVTERLYEESLIILSHVQYYTILLLGIIGHLYVSVETKPGYYVTELDKDQI